MEEYRAADFQTEIGLDRQKLIYLALLLGSDYTEGISGIGIVNAVGFPLKQHNGPCYICKAILVSVMPLKTAKDQ